MTLEQIKASVAAGRTVCWKQLNYLVIDGGVAGYLIKCTNNNHCVGLTWQDGVTMNGKEEDFFLPSVFQCWNEGMDGYTNYGSFQTTIFQAYRLADSGNQEILQEAFSYWFSKD